MTISKITAEQFSEPQLRLALQEHREDRAVLLASLSASFRADPRIRAAWLWGSFGRSEADDLSDLDPWLIVTDEAAPQMGASLAQYAENTGSLICGSEYPRNAPLGGGSYGSLHEGRHGLLHVDCYWQPPSAQAPVPEYAVLFDRLDEHAGAEPVSFSPAASEPTNADPIEDGLGFTWLMFSIAAKHLARDPNSDMALLLYPKPGLENALRLLGEEQLITPLDWSMSKKPMERLARLRALVEKTGRATEIANAQGVSMSLQYAPCLLRYLDMVEGILMADAV